MGSAGLAEEVTLTIVGNEEGANGSVAIVGAEIAVAAIEAAELAAGPSGFEDWSADGRIPERLRQIQVFGLTDGAEFVPMLLVVFVEQRGAAKARAGGAEEERQKKDAKKSCHQTIRSFRLAHAEPIARIVLHHALDAIEAVGRWRQEFDAFGF